MPQQKQGSDSYESQREKGCGVNGGKNLKEYEPIFSRRDSGRQKHKEGGGCRESEAVLSSVLPPSHVQRGDQASIIGDVINYVKELQQILQSLEAQRRIKQPLDFFTFSPPPHYSYSATPLDQLEKDSMANAVADVQMSIVQGHVNVK